MIYYVKVNNNMYPVSSFDGSVKGFLDAGSNWSLSCIKKDGTSFGLHKEDTDSNLYYRDITNPDYKVELPVNIDNLNLKNSDTYTLETEEARLTILKLQAYFQTINEYKCVER